MEVVVEIVLGGRFNRKFVFKRFIKPKKNMYFLFFLKK